MSAPDWSQILETFRNYASEEAPPSLNRITDDGASPFQILVATILSLRTRDDVTLRTAKAVFAQAKTPEEILQLDLDTLAALMFPAGFYRTKAKQVLEISQILVTGHGSKVPQERDLLLGLPGVGPKTANLVLNLAFGIEAICVDTHVHRISNRQGWVTTETPEQTESALMKILPREYWIEFNPLLVQYGQDVCSPASPHCSTCAFTATCPKVGVLQSR